VTDVWISVLGRGSGCQSQAQLVDDGAVLSLWCISVLYISWYLVSQYLISYLSAHGVRGVSVE